MERTIFLSKRTCERRPYINIGQSDGGETIALRLGDAKEVASKILALVASKEETGEETIGVLPIYP